MSQFNIHTLNSAPPESHIALEAVQKKYGGIPNLLAIMSENPSTLKAYLALSELFADSGLTPVEQQIVLLTVSWKNECSYCVSAHSMTAEKSGVPRDFIEALRNGKPLGDEKLQALRSFIQNMVDQHGWLTDAEVTSFLSHGYSQKHVLAVVLGVAMKTLSNYVNHIAHTPLDPMFKQWEWSER